MRGNRIFLMAAILALAACRDGTGVTNPDVTARVAPDGPSRWVDGRYPTEEEYYAELGDARPTISGENPTGSFSSDLSAWNASGRLGWQYMNVGWGKLGAEVRYKDGSLINSGEDTWSFDQFLPIIAAEWHSFQVSVSTINHTCDIVGKARLQGSGSAKLLKWGGGSLATLWTVVFDNSAPDLTLPPCNASECDDPSTPEIEPCDSVDREEPISSTPGGGGGGDCPECVDVPPDGPTSCWVRYWYNKSTGEILNWYILYCV